MRRPQGRRRRDPRRAAPLAVLLASASVLAAACGSPGSSAPGTLSASAGGNAVALLGAARTAIGTLLTNGTGYTLYWFNRDTATSSACTDVCTSNWPPVTGRPRPAPGVSLPGTLSAFVRSDGLVQAVYDGHPLYTYAGDFEPGDVGGDDLTEFGGTWYAVKVG